MSLAAALDELDERPRVVLGEDGGDDLRGRACPIGASAGQALAEPTPERHTIAQIENTNN